MPELPEVEAARRQIAAALLGKKIDAVQAFADPLVLNGLAQKDFDSALIGAKVKGVGRKGKYWWLELDRKPWLFGHFGMSGRVAILDEREALPKFVKLVLKAGKKRVALSDGRRLGRIWLADGPDEDKRLRALGFDALDELPRSNQLQQILSKRKAPIKAVLLDQGLFAGIGNYMADEVLYRARIAPKRLANSLSAEEVKKLRKEIASVTRQAVDAVASGKDLPDNWLFQVRWNRHGTATIRGHTVVRETIGGRTAAWVPDLQK